MFVFLPITQDLCPLDAWLWELGLSHHRYFACSFLKEPGDSGWSLPWQVGPLPLDEVEMEEQGLLGM